MRDPKGPGGMLWNPTQARTQRQKPSAGVSRKVFTKHEGAERPLPPPQAPP